VEPSLGPVRLTDVVDILAVAALVYTLLAWIRQTPAALVASGLLILAALSLTAQVLDLRLTSWVLRGFFALSVVIVVVIFQEELRQLFERLAVWSLGGRRRRRRSTPGATADVVTACVAEFASRRINPRQLGVTVEASLAATGRRTFEVRQENIRHPPELNVQQVRPTAVRILVERSPPERGAPPGTQLASDAADGPRDGERVREPSDDVGRGGRVTARPPACPTPPGWTLDPSSWSQRLPLVALALLGFVVAGYLALYQWRLLPTVWEPFFGQGSIVILDSPVSRILPIPDAALGALAYLLDAVTGAIGGRARWRTMPWMVIAFGVLVGPLGAVSVLLVVLQPVRYDAWCTLCLASAAISLLMIGPAMDEVLANLQHLARTPSPARWRAFWGR
jgi:uncharacterized membrane protein